MQQRFYQAVVTQIYHCTVIFFLTLIPNFSWAVSHIGHITKSDTQGLPGDLLIFPDVWSVSRFDQGPKHVLANNEVIPELNVFYTFDYQRFRFLGEWLLSTKTHNLERIQLGMHLGESSLWLGRFHNPIGYWNMQFHHAAFLQTTISRPGVMAFETAGGVIPNHLTGLLWEGIHEFGVAGLYYTLGAGAGPELKNGLGAFNVVEPGGSHRPAVALRLGYQPISYGLDEIGISAAYTEIPGDGVNLNKTKQLVAGVYANLQFKSVHFLSETIYVNNWLDRPQTGKTSSGFISTYGQLEWNFQPDWTLVGRIEGTFGTHNDPYLELFPKFVENRFLGGIRYKLSRTMALKLEVSRDQLREDRFSQVMLQWSAVFP